MSYKPTSLCKERELRKKAERERDEALMDRGNGDIATMTRNHYERILRERDEAREALRQIWQSGDAFLPYIDSETTKRWRRAAGWEGTK